MEAAKKRKRDDEVEPPRITYDAATRTFDRLFKEDSLEEMKNVVRKKLGVSTAVPVYLSQIRDGKSVDLDDDEDFEAFRAVTRFSAIVKVKVILGGHPTNGQLVNGSAMEPKTPKRKKKKPRVSDAVASTSSVLSAGPSGDPSASDERSSSPPHKKRRVSFLEPLALEQVSVPKTPKKKQTKALSDPLPKNATAHEHDGRSTQSIHKNDAVDEASEKRIKKNNKRLDQPNGDTGTSDLQNELSSAGAQDTGRSTDEPTSKRSKKKRRRESLEANVAIEKVNNASTSTNQALIQPPQEEDTTRPAKKSKKKHAAPTEEVVPKKSSRSKSVPPGAAEPLPTTPAPVSEDKEAEVPSRKVKKLPNKKDRAVSEPPTKEAGLDTVTKSTQPEEQEEDVIVLPKRKSKSKQKDANVLDEAHLETFKAAASSTKPLEQAKEKQSKLPSTSSLEPFPESYTDDLRPEKPKKSSRKDRAKSKAPEEDVHAESAEPAGADEPKRKRKKSEKAAATSEEHEETETLKKSKKAQDPEEQERQKAAVKATIQAVIARKTAPSAPTAASSTSPPVHSPTGPNLAAVTQAQLSETVQPPAAEPSPITRAPTIEPVNEEDQTPPEPSSNATKPTKKPKAPSPSACPYCDESPFHFKTKCPVMSGIRVMRKRLEELENEVEDDEAKREQRAAAMSELHSMIEKKTRKPKTSTTGAVTKKGKVKEMADNQEEGEHVEEEDKVIHTKKKVATKPVAADEEPDEEHESSDEKEQTDTRRSKRETSKQKTDNKLQAKGKPKTQEEPEREDSSEDDVPAKEPHKQVDVIASTTPHVVDVHPRSSVPPPPSSSPAPTPNSQPPPSTQPQKTRDDPLTSTPRPSSQPYPSKHTAPSQTPSKNKILPNKIPSQELGNLSLVVDISTLGDLSQYTDKDVESLLYPKVSIKDVHFLNEDEDVNADKLEDDSLLEEEKEEEELKRHKKRGRKTRDSPSSDEEEEEDAEDSVDKDSPSRSPSLEPLAEAAEPLARRSVSKSLLGEEPNPSFREVDTRGSSREMDKSGNDAVEDALAEDLAPIQLAATINKAMMDPDSDTAVASNGEDAVPDLPSPEKPASVRIVRQRSDSIEEPLEDGGRQPVDPIVSDDGVPVTRPTHRVEVVIRTRSQKKKEGQSSADMKKLSELPIPSPSMRIIKPSPTTTPLAPPVPARLTRARKGVVDKRARSSPVPRAEEADSEGETPTQTKTRSGRISKAVIKSTKSATKPPSKAASTSASQTSLTTSTSKPVSTNDHTPAKPPPKTPEPKKANPLPKGTPLDPEKPVEEESGEQDPNDPASQWATLKESQIASQETPGQLDELISSNGSQKDPDEPASSPNKLFLPSETQPSFPYSQFADTPGSQPPPANKPSPNDSDDEDEVANSVIKPRAPRPQYRGLSSMAGSQFAMPKFKPENSGNSRRPKDDLYGMADKKDGSGSASDTDSDSDEEQPLASQSHIAPSRRAGAQTTKA